MAPIEMTDEDLYRERLRLALEAAELDLWENNLTTGVVTQRVTRVFADLGYDEQESLAYMDDLFALVHPDDLEGVKAAIAKHVSGETERYRCEFRLRAHDGAWVWYANYGKVMAIDHGRFGTRFIGVTFNIDERKRREEELAELNRRLEAQNLELTRMNATLQTLATTDAMTGLANRRLLFETGEKECRRGPRFGQSLSLLVFDVDHFKRINDSWGHPIGDSVLLGIANLCRTRFRQGSDLAGRIGGEEFAILLPGTPYAEAMHVAEWLRGAVAGLNFRTNDAATVACTISVGVAAMPAEAGAKGESPWDFELLMRNADRALYRAKVAGRNRVEGAEARPAVE